MDTDSEESVAHRDAADEIRQHLVMLRGGAPFLSSADALLLVQWLDQGVSVEAVLCALERASEARRRSRSRVPLRLGHARRHLGKVGRPAWRKPPETERSHPLGPLLATLEVAALTDPAVESLASTLAGLEPVPADALLRAALREIRSFLQATYAALPSEQQETLRRAAEEELGDLVDMVDAATLGSIIEETARDLFRQRYPWASAATVHMLVET